MKSLSQIPRQPRRLLGEQTPQASRLNHPLTDYQFQGAGPEMKSAGTSHKLTRPVFAPRFRDLSAGFLGAETKRDYLGELLFFAIIVGISTWPIVSMIRALAELTK